LENIDFSPFAKWRKESNFSFQANYYRK
jgi:hypothetical protein